MIGSKPGASEAGFTSEIPNINAIPLEELKNRNLATAAATAVARLAHIPVTASGSQGGQAHRIA